MDLLNFHMQYVYIKVAILLQRDILFSQKVFDRLSPEFAIRFSKKVAVFDNIIAKIPQYAYQKVSNSNELHMHCQVLLFFHKKVNVFSVSLNPFDDKKWSVPL